MREKDLKRPGSAMTATDAPAVLKEAVFPDLHKQPASDFRKPAGAKQPRPPFRWF